MKRAISLLVSIFVFTSMTIAVPYLAFAEEKKETPKVEDKAKKDDKKKDEKKK